MLRAAAAATLPSNPRGRSYRFPRMHDPPSTPEPAHEPDDVDPVADREASDADGREAPPGTNDDELPVAAPIIGCPRCEARLTLGSRYCSSCGAPQVRSGEQAATALSRTRRNAPQAVRIAVPSLVSLVVVAVVLIASHDPAGGRGDVGRQLEAAADAHRVEAGRKSAKRADSAAGRDAPRTPAARKLPKAKRSSPFLVSVDRVVDAGQATHTKQRRVFALLRSARDGVGDFPGSGVGARPKSPEAALAEAERLAGEVVTERTAAAGRAREVSARQQNQQAIVLKLALFYEAGAATARQLGSCLGSFSATAPDEVARRCLEQSRDLTGPEAKHLQAFRASYAPARKAAGLSTPGARL